MTDPRPGSGNLCEMRNAGASRALLLGLAAGLVAVVSAPPTAAQDEGPPAGAVFRRAEIAERSLGDLERAAELYLAAAQEADDPLGRGLAELRAASCLARLGRHTEASALAETWTEVEGAGTAAQLRFFARDVLASVDRRPPPAPETARSPQVQQVADLEEELAQMRRDLERAMSRAASEADDLARKLLDKDREIERLRRTLPPDESATPEELLERRKRELDEAGALSRMWAAWARVLHREGRFEEARAFLYDALAKNPDNADAKALLGRVAPLGDREHLYRRVREVLALAREVRQARLAAEVQYLVQQARRRQESGDLAGSLAPLERALAMIESGDVALRGAFAIREDLQRRLRRVEAAGIAREPVEAPAPEPLEERWGVALRALLEAAGDEVAGGLVLRFHDLDSALPPPVDTLPPVPISEPPAGWTLSARGVRAGPLLLAWLRGTDRQAFATPGASLEVVGATAVAVADQEVQLRLAQWLADLSRTTPPTVEVEVTTLSAPPGVWRAETTARGISSFALQGGGAGAVLSPGDYDALLADPGAGAGRVLLRATFRATHLRPFRLTGGGATGGVSLDVLPVAAPAKGAAVRLATTWRPRGQDETVPLAAEAAAGAVVAPGGALLVRGLVDPSDRTRDVVTVVRVGRRKGARPAGGEEPPSDVTPLPPASGRMRVAAHQLPRSIGRVTEVNATAFRGVGNPLPTRASALEARLARIAPGATTLELRDDRVLVVGPEAVHEAVAAFIGRLGAVAGVQRFRVQAYALDAASEKQVFGAAPGLSAAPGGGLAMAILSEGTDRAVLADLRRILVRQARSLDPEEPEVAAPPTVRADAARVLRTPYRSELDATPGDDRAWGRAETEWMDEGYVVALRPFGRTRRGRADLDVDLRVVWTRDRGVQERRTPLGPAPVLAPRSAVVEGRLAVTVGADDTLVLADLPNPFDAGGERPRMIILVALAR